MAGGGGIKVARHRQVLGHQLAHFIELGQLILGQGMVGGGGGLQQRQCPLGIGRSRLTANQHVGKVGLGGGKTGLGGAFVHILGALGIFLCSQALAAHHRDIAHGGKVVVVNRRPDFVGLGIITRVIGGDTGIERALERIAGLGTGTAARRKPQQERYNWKQFAHGFPSGQRLACPRPGCYGGTMMADIGGPVDDGGIAPGRDPFALFGEWLKQAEASEPNDPNAMSLATVDARGPAQCAHGAAQGRGSQRLRLLLQ